MIVVVPMAGHGKRFKDAGITTPKPLIDVRGSWMLEWSLKSFDLARVRKIVFVIAEEHERAYQISSKLKEKFGNQCVCAFDPAPQGAASSALFAKTHIDTDEDIIIKDADGYIRSDVHEAVAKNYYANIDGILFTTNLPGDRFSFAKVGDDGFVTSVAEKKRISNHVITGMYYFRRGSDFVRYAEVMVKANKRSHKEFYIAPVYQEMIDDGKKIIIDEVEKLWDLGTPEMLDYFLKNFPLKA